MRANRGLALLAVLSLACGDGGSEPPHTTAVIVAPASLTIDEGSTGTFTAVVTLSNGQPASAPVVAWLSANPAIATAAGAGSTATITGVSVGQTSVTATSDGVAGSATVIVRQAPAARVSVSLASTTIVLQATSQATASVFDAQGRLLAGRQVQWTSSNPSIATITASGLVRGISKGAAFVKATVEGRSDSAIVSVLGVVSVVVSPHTVSMPLRSTVTATATVNADPGIASAVLWSSSSPSVATVSSTGVITSVGPPSTVKIFAQSAIDPTKYDSVLVTVLDPCSQPTPYVLGTSASGVIQITDCGGTTDEFLATVTAPTFYSVSATTSFAFSIFPYWAIPIGGFFSVPSQAQPLYALAPAGSIRIRVVSRDTATGGSYTLTTTVNPPDVGCSIVMARGLSRPSALIASCQVNLGGGSQVTARTFHVPAPTPTSGPLVVRANAAGYPLRLELRNGATILASAVAPAAGQEAVLTYSVTQNPPHVLSVYLTGPASNTTGPFTFTVNP